MKISYIANIRLPTEKAHGIQIMKMCEAFALLGHEVQIVVPRRANTLSVDLFEYYSVVPSAREKIHIVYTPSIELIKLGKIGFWIQTWIFAQLASFKMRKFRPGAVISRDVIVLLNMILIHPNLVWEAHRDSLNFATKLLLKKAKVVAISEGLMRLYFYHVPNPSRIRTIPDAVEIQKFSIPVTVPEARRKLCLPAEKKIALYAGHLYDWKGAQVLALAAQGFEENELAVFVGGTDFDIAAFTERNKDAKNIAILGRKPHSEIPYYLKAADVLVIPNSAKVKISSHYTSPLKLFEYMASGKAIVASDLPSLREILDENTAFFVEPDNAESLRLGIQKLFKNGVQAAQLGNAAHTKVQNYTWEKRAKYISKFIQP